MLQRSRPVVGDSSVHACRLGVIGAVGTIAGVVLSGPLAVALVSATHPQSLLGVATALIAGVFQGTRIERAARFTFVANGPVSVAGALLTTALPGWMMTPWGLVAFSLWNVLLVVMVVFAWLALRRRLNGMPLARTTSWTSSKPWSTITG